MFLYQLHLLVFLLKSTDVMRLQKYKLKLKESAFCLHHLTKHFSFVTFGSPSLHINCAFSEQGISETI